MNTAIHTFHGRTGAEQTKIAIQNARDIICGLCQNPPSLAPRFPSIYEVPLGHRLKMSLQTAEQWISLIAHQVKVTQHNLKCLLRQHKPLKDHFRTMRREASQNAS